MSDEFARQQALIILERANRRLAKGELADAIVLFERSLAIWPTADAYTGLGQAYSLTDRYDEAIEFCHKAIAIDASSGRAYNDIAVYLMELGQWEEAIHWLEMAIKAKRYDSPQLSYFNLGRVYSHLGQYRTALKYLDLSIAVDPFHRPAIWAKFALLAKMN